MNTIASVKTAKMTHDLCREIKANEDLTLNSRRTAENAMKQLTAAIMQDQDPVLIQEFAVITYAKALYWLSEKEQAEYERFIYPHLYNLRLSKKVRNDLLEEIRLLVTEIYTDSLQEIDICFEAEEVFRVALAPKSPIRCFGLRWKKRSR